MRSLTAMTTRLDRGRRWWRTQWRRSPWLTADHLDKQKRRKLLPPGIVPTSLCLHAAGLRPSNWFMEKSKHQYLAIASELYTGMPIHGAKIARAWEPSRVVRHHTNQVMVTLLCCSYMKFYPTRSIEYQTCLFVHHVHHSCSVSASFKRSVYIYIFLKRYHQIVCNCMSSFLFL